MTEPYELEPGSDCWGYSPNIPIRDIADIVGIILVNGNDEWSYTTDKDKQILVYTNIY